MLIFPVFFLLCSQNRKFHVDARKKQKAIYNKGFDSTEKAVSAGVKWLN